MDNGGLIKIVAVDKSLEFDKFESYREVVGDIIDSSLNVRTVFGNKVLGYNVRRISPEGEASRLRTMSYLASLEALAKKDILKFSGKIMANALEGGRCDPIGSNFYYFTIGDNCSKTTFYVSWGGEGYDCRVEKAEDTSPVRKVLGEFGLL